MPQYTASELRRPAKPRSKNLQGTGTVVEGGVVKETTVIPSEPLFNELFEKDTTSVPGTTLIHAKFGIWTAADVMVGGPGTGGGGSGSTVSWSQLVSSGTKIATVTIDGVTTDVYAPTGGSGTVTDYNSLTSRPQIAGITLEGNKTLADLGIATASALTSHTGDATIHVTASDKQSWNGKQDAITMNSKLSFALIDSTPTTLSGYGIVDAKIQGGVITLGTATITPYVKQNGGIPKTDLASAVQTSLDKADSALQAHQSLDGYWSNANSNLSTVDWSCKNLYAAQGVSIANKSMLAYNDALYIASGLYGQSIDTYWSIGRSLYVRSNSGYIASIGSDAASISLNVTQNGNFSIADGKKLKFLGNAGMTNAYFAIHPEGGQDAMNVLPYFSNDIAFLERRGGSVDVYTTTSTTFTADTLSGKAAVGGGGNKNDMFDGSAKYYGFEITSENANVVIDITLHKDIAASTVLYIDFGNMAWYFKNIRIFYSASASGASFTEIADAAVTNLAVPYYRYAWAGAAGGANTRRLRFVMSGGGNLYEGKYYHRIAELGVVNYDSSIGRETFMSLGSDDLVYRSISPAASISGQDAYTLGTSVNRWGKLWAAGADITGTGAVTIHRTTQGSTLALYADGSVRNQIDMYSLNSSGVSTKYGYICSNMQSLGDGLTADMAIIGLEHSVGLLCLSNQILGHVVGNRWYDIYSSYNANKNTVDWTCKDLVAYGNASFGNETDGAYIKIGKIKIQYIESDNCIKFIHTTSGQVANIQVTGDVTVGQS